MKTMKNLFKVILTFFAAVTFFSCDLPVGLGAKLDIFGPVITITNPSQRKSVRTEFSLEGTASDDSGVNLMMVKAVTRGRELARQWRYKNGTGWEISNNSGSTWAPYENAVWSGTNKSASWKVFIDLNIVGSVPEEGEYTFGVQAWDKGDFSDDNSYKTVVLIVDRDAPSISVTYPIIYENTNADYIDLASKADGDDAKTDPSYLGKFITQGFDLKWQIDDFSPIWSVDIRLYKANEAAPDDNNYIYKYSKNLPPPPDKINPADYQRPNGSESIPELTKPAGAYGEGYLKNPIIDNDTQGITPIKIIATCYDAAGNKNSVSTLGYFVYWPKANRPWIAFSDDMYSANDYYGTDVSANSNTENKTFMVYPNKDIKATAYQAHGLKEVQYTVWVIPTSGDPVKLGAESSAVFQYGGTAKNEPSQSGIYSTIFPWKFEVPDLTGYYIVRAKAIGAPTAYSSNTNNASDEYVMLFRVNDITFPDFPSSPEPAASDPLFMAIDNNNQIKISGIVSDATNIESLCLAWINPESEGFAAMSQLNYFRDQNYKGWQTILNYNGPGNTTTETFQSSYPNRLWKIPVTKYLGKLKPDGKYEYPDGIDEVTKRRMFKYEQIISLTNLNIGNGKQPLKSQMFLLRAENPAKHATIITYAPQGDTTAPVIQIENVKIMDGTTTKATCIPNTYTVIDKFVENWTIQINGIWEEDSLGKWKDEQKDSMEDSNLDINDYFRKYFKININNTEMPFPTIEKKTATTGTWILTATVKQTPTAAAQVSLASLNDTLVIDAETSDIGGNRIQIGASWLIQSDNLKLMRISSEMDDGTYSTYNTNNAEIEIFLEFSKPVKLTNGGTPELILTSNTGNTARAFYKGGQAELNSRQYFVYKIASGQTTNSDFLNVKGLWNNNAVVGNTYTGTYSFTWSRGGLPTDSGYEEVRITTTANKKGEPPKEGVVANTHNGYYVRTLPTTNSKTDPDYQYTLLAGKNIKIDTAAPTVSSITATTAAGWYNSGDIYITATFNEPVIIGANLPRLNLTIGNGTGATSTAASDVRVNNNTISFRYTIRDGDSSRGNPISVTGFSGSITDLAGNPLPATAISATTLTGIYIETLKPQYPQVRVTSANLTTPPTDSSSAIRSNVDGTTSYGSSSQTPRTLSNVYFKELYIAIRGQSDSDYNGNQYATLEYSTDGGKNWITAPNFNNMTFPITQTGTYNLVARQIDRAGNISENSPAITFNWDKGDIISRISSENANGTYSQNSDPIKITVYFRKPIYFSAGPATITIDAKRGDNNIELSSTVTTTGNTDYSSLDFIYTIQNGDTTNGNNLDVVSANITGVTAWDNKNTAPDKATRVNLTTPNNLLTLPANTPKLDKQIKVVTGSLNQTPTPSFIADADAGTGYNIESNSNFHGIRTDDGSYWTTLLIPFNREISKGTGLITIQQSPTNYRIPAVMTEAQYNRFKGKLGETIDTYYTKGTNGAPGGTSDTATKYVLQYNYTPTAVGNGTNDIPTAFNNDFRNAEQIQINVNAQAVSLSDDKKTLKVRLSGSNAPQVPGATYTVTWDAGIVSDTLGNSSAANTPNLSVTLRGVAKPFVRTKKTQDTITISTGNASNANPRIVAAQPTQATVRMDCRTPNSTIYFNSTNNTTNITANNLNPRVDGTQKPTAGAAPGQPTQPVIGTTDTTAGTPPTAGTNYRYGNPVTIGNNPTNLADIQGYKWRVRARANATVNGTATYSDDSEEIAYRTVITYQLRNGNNAITAGTGEQILGDGDQIWIRGGDAIGSSSIPGFPFTWVDDWDNLSGKRAGIRLMTKTSGDSLNNSIWKYVTWDLSATAYIDFIMGHDTSASNTTNQNVIWQYGPINWAYQRAGWTSFKDYYPIFPGEHRWCDAGNNHTPGGSSDSKGAINFSGTFSARPTLTNSPTGSWLNSQ